MPTRWPSESSSEARVLPIRARLPADTGRGEVAAGSGPLLRAGERAAGLAHDIRNALTLAQLALEREVQPTGLELVETGRALEEARALCARFLAGSDGAADWEPVLLRDLLVGELEAVARLHPGGAAVVLRCPRRLQARTDATALGRAVQNLTLNAVRASAPGDVVRVRARALGPWICVVVDDPGRGMDERELAVAMSPAGSTRGAGGGFGSVSLLDCVRELGARLVVRSASGVGTRCHLVIPADTADAMGGRWRVDPDADRLQRQGPERIYADVGAFELALRGGRPDAVVARRTLPVRELERLRALCAQASVPLQLEGVAPPG